MTHIIVFDSKKVSEQRIQVQENKDYERTVHDGGCEATHQRRHPKESSRVPESYSVTEEAAAFLFLGRLQSIHSLSCRRGGTSRLLYSLQRVFRGNRTPEREAHE